MGITPITNIFPLTAARATKVQLDPPPMERAEHSAGTGDETYSPSNGNPSGGSEEDTAGDEILQNDESQIDLEPPTESAASPAEGNEPTAVNFFA